VDFCPPSAFAHARALYGDVVRWRDPATVALPMDAAFLSELAAKERVFAQTHELTCFKFNAAWRRDSYKLRTVDEQERMLRQIESGVDFRHRELLDVVQAVVSGRFAASEVPPTAGIAAGEYVRRNRRFKGVDRRFDPETLVRITERTRFGMDDQTMLFEWYDLERNEQGSFRWSGPSRTPTIDLPVLLDRDLRVRIHVMMLLRPEMAGSITLSLHGRPLDVRIKRGERSTLVETIVRPADADVDRDFGITIDTGEVTRPCDLGLGADRRWLGIAVSGIELEPLD
jgi:hypothetical protein